MSKVYLTLILWIALQPVTVLNAQNTSKQILALPGTNTSQQKKSNQQKKAENIIIILNPKECTSCISSLRTTDVRKSNLPITVILPVSAKQDGIILTQRAFGFNTNFNVIYSDSLYDYYSPNNISYLVVENKNKIIKKIALSILGEISSFSIYDPGQTTWHTTAIIAKQEWSTKVKIGIGKDDLFLLDNIKNTLYSIESNKVIHATSNTILQPTYSWSPTQLSYREWYLKYFADSSGLARSIRLTPVLEKIGRKDAYVASITCTSEREGALLSVQWPHVAPEGENESSAGVRLKTIFAKVDKEKQITFYPKYRQQLDSAGYSISTGKVYWKTDSTFIGALNPDADLLDKHQVLTRPVIGEFALRHGQLFWKHSLRNVSWPLLQLRDQKAIGDYMIIVPDFFYAKPYIFYQAANEIIDTDTGTMYSLPSYSDKANSFNVRINKGEVKLNYELKAASLTKKGDIICIVKQGNDHHALLLDKYLTVLTDTLLESSLSSSKSWAIHQEGYVVSFNPTTNALESLHLY